MGGRTLKIPISSSAVIDLDAPTIPAYEVSEQPVRWVVWCRHCRDWHSHAPAEGHYESQCHDPCSPYRKWGYNIALRGKWTRFYFGRSPEDL
jgi:hypothetical protein